MSESPTFEGVFGRLPQDKPDYFLDYLFEAWRAGNRLISTDVLRERLNVQGSDIFTVQSQARQRLREATDNYQITQRMRNVADGSKRRIHYAISHSARRRRQ